MPPVPTDTPAARPGASARLRPAATSRSNGSAVREASRARSHGRQLRRLDPRLSSRRGCRPSRRRAASSRAPRHGRFAASAWRSAVFRCFGRSAQGRTAVGPQAGRLPHRRERACRSRRRPPVLPPGRARTPFRSPIPAIAPGDCHAANGVSAPALGTARLSHPPAFARVTSRGGDGVRDPRSTGRAHCGGSASDIQLVGDRRLPPTPFGRDSRAE